MTHIPERTDIKILTELDERILDEMSTRGLLGPIEIQLSSGNIYEVEFMTPARIEHELNLVCEHGSYGLGIPGVIAVQDVTIENIMGALNQMCKERYFDYLKPIAQ